MKRQIISARPHDDVFQKTLHLDGTKAPKSDLKKFFTIELIYL